ncbi:MULTISPECIES: DUF2626 domain-containing protein [Alteribacter]|uniref:DUF2626 domain-containing protein n=1 Tax=Alteribacter keqinensis TaxID=2483800 RepID=A0A3M7TVX6_9BACI|nr:MULTISPECIES: DUF2626 domain-containing protein [Alteribacter]MBM7097323.1 DUF2626 domain-containing protein [Alteribacter salitolerans]RNA68944.1 DUF2626 domain-containing protein [Alteribacter keqinensis]
MDRMFRVISFWTGIMAVLFMVGGMYEMAMLFFGQTGVFLALSYLNLTERTYIYIFGAYLTLFFVGFTYYTTFIMVPGVGH